MLNTKVSLNTQIFLGALVGVALGLILGHWSPPSAANKSFLSALEFLGKIFINLLKIILIPLIFTSITAAIANLKNVPQSKKIWSTLLCYSLTTTALAAISGLVVMNLVKPGVGLDIHLFKEKMSSASVPSLSASDFARNMSHNPIFAVILLAAVLGISIIILGPRSEGILKIINRLFELMMTIVRWIMRVAPLGVMGLLAKLVAQSNTSMLYVLSKYIVVVVGTTLFHGLVTLPLILWLITKISPWQFFLGLKEAFITAFSTSSSTATLPVSLRCITENLKVDSTVARFVLPIGSVFNMDGTALYEAMAALFVANLCGVHLGLASQLMVVLTAIMCSIGAPGIPSAGMVTMIIVLQSVGLPVQAVGILIAIDRPLDTIRTVVNVEGDCVGACVVQKIVRAHAAA